MGDFGLNGFHSFFRITRLRGPFRSGLCAKLLRLRVQNAVFQSEAKAKHNTDFKGKSFLRLL